MRSFVNPQGEKGHVVRIDEPKRLRALAQEAVDEGGLPGPVRPGEEDEGGHGTSDLERGIALNRDLGRPIPKVCSQPRDITAAKLTAMHYHVTRLLDDVEDRRSPIQIGNERLETFLVLADNIQQIRKHRELDRVLASLDMPTNLLFFLQSLLRSRSNFI
jgi:hypothetical protein